VKMKKTGHPNRATSHPLVADSTSRGNAISELSSAYCVAV